MISRFNFVLSALLACLLQQPLTASPPAPSDPLPQRISIATWNVEWFFDNYQGDNRSDLAKKLSAPSAEEWRWRLDQVARVVAEMKPTILALQEVENREVVYQLCKTLEDQHGLKYRIAFIPGYDFYTEQQVAVIYQSGCVEYSRREQSAEMFNSNQYYNLNKHLFARFEWGAGDDRQSLVLATTHLRATPEAADIRTRQTRLLRHWLEPDLDDPRQNVVALGDFNSEEFYGRERPGSELMVLRKPDANAIAMRDLNEFLPADQRNTHMIEREFDRIIVSPSLLDDEPDRRDFVFESIKNYRALVVRGSQDLDHRDQYYQIDPAERDVSDHYPLMAEFIVK